VKGSGVRGWFLVCSLSACLSVDNVGEDRPEETCADPAQATTSDARRACITATIEDLSDGIWIGQASTDELSVRCMFEFAADGSYRVTSLDDQQSAFGALFLTPNNQLEGHYQLTDLLNGRDYYGAFERPLGSGSLRSDLEQLQIMGDSLTFLWRSTLADFSPLTLQLVLTRHR